MSVGHEVRIDVPDVPSSPSYLTGGGARQATVRANPSSPSAPSLGQARHRPGDARSLGSPRRIGVATGAVALCFAGLRFAVAARGNIASFIIVGANRATRTGLPQGVPVFRGSGYDGQFYYRLALDPLAWGSRAFGITLDTPYRIDRIGYPALAWLVAAGRGPLLPVALVLVNVVALGVLGGLGAALARDAGRPPLWGLVFAGYWGLLWSLSRDLTEIVTAAAVVGGLLALRRDRPLLAALALSVAVLSRESALVLVGALCVARLAEWTAVSSRVPPHRRSFLAVSERTGPSSLDLAWIVPLLVFGAWEGAVDAKVGVLPLMASRTSNVGVPVLGITRGVTHYLGLLPSGAALLWFGELTLLGIIGVMAACALRSTEARLHERLAWIGYGVLTISLAPSIWLGDVGFRSLDDFFLFSWVVLICSRRRLGIPGGLVALAWLVVCVELVLYI